MPSATARWAIPGLQLEDGQGHDSEVAQWTVGMISRLRRYRQTTTAVCYCLSRWSYAPSRQGRIGKVGVIGQRFQESENRARRDEKTEEA